MSFPRRSYRQGDEAGKEGRGHRAGGRFHWSGASGAELAVCVVDVYGPVGLGTALLEVKRWNYRKLENVPCRIWLYIGLTSIQSICLALTVVTTTTCRRKTSWGTFKKRGFQRTWQLGCISKSKFRWSNTWDGTFLSLKKRPSVRNPIRCSRFCGRMSQVLPTSFASLLNPNHSNSLCAHLSLWRLWLGFLVFHSECLWSI